MEMLLRVKPELWVTEDIHAAAEDVFLQVRPESLVLAGGRTPAPTYRRLAGLDYPWEDVECFFTDERCVPPDHPASNYRMAYESLLSRVPARVHRMRGEACDAAGYEAELRRFFSEQPSFDLAFLGLGSEGHTASLFPDDPVLEEQERLVAVVQRPDYSRLTLTLPALNATRWAVFLVEGPRKARAVQCLLAGDDIPAARMRPDRMIVIADPAAAAASR